MKRGFAEPVCNEGLDYLLETWQRTVNEISDGYRALFDEFLNDMVGRQIIREWMPLAPEEERTRMLEPLASLDRSFLKGTRAVNVCIWGENQAAQHGYDPQQNWWYYRVPDNLDSVEDKDAWPR